MQHDEPPSWFRMTMEDRVSHGHHHHRPVGPFVQALENLQGQVGPVPFASQECGAGSFGELERSAAEIQTMMISDAASNTSFRRQPPFSRCSWAHGPGTSGALRISQGPFMAAMVHI